MYGKRYVGEWKIRLGLQKKFGQSPKWDVLNWCPNGKLNLAHLHLGGYALS